MNVSPSVALSRCFRSPRFSFDVKKVVEEREREREEGEWRLAFTPMEYSLGHVRDRTIFLMARL